VLSSRALSASVAAGRVVIGAALLAAPAATGRRWLGSAAETGGGGVAVRALGARDFTLGVLTLVALRDESPLGPVLVAGSAFCDLADGGALLAARREVPAAGVATGVFAFGSAALGAGLARALLRD
jgi:hypothetical protein